MMVIYVNSSMTADERKTSILKQQIIYAMELTGGDLTKASEWIGIVPRTLRNHITENFNNFEIYALRSGDVSRTQVLKQKEVEKVKEKAQKKIEVDLQESYVSTHPLFKEHKDQLTPQKRLRLVMKKTIDKFISGNCSYRKANFTEKQEILTRFIKLHGFSPSEFLSDYGF